MNWKTRFTLLMLTAIPAFSGYPLHYFDTEIVSGISWGWVLYFLTVHVVISTLMGKTIYSNCLTIAALILSPVIFIGGVLSCCLLLIGLSASPQSVFSRHYVFLSITMLTVIPLALSLVATVPFHDLENRLMKHVEGVSRLQKWALMFLRVFNHIVYFVIPDILEVLREEQQHSVRSKRTSAPDSKCRRPKQNVTGLIKTMTQLSIEGICASIQYIPLWAVEISQLPRKTSTKSRRYLPWKKQRK